MKFPIHQIIIIISIGMISSCSSSRKMKPSTKSEDTSAVITKPIADNDSFKISYNYLRELKDNKINFKTFSGKAKVQFEDKNGRQPDANAIIRLEKDSIIWISISSTFLNIEVARILITPDTLIVMNKLEKSVESHPYQYIQQVVQLPLTFPMLQDIIVGNAVLVGDSILSTFISGNSMMIETGDTFFKNLLTISTGNHLLANSKITDNSPGRSRTASLEYSDYSPLDRHWFATYRALKVDKPANIDLRISFKEFEFNNELSFPFSVPGNYKTK